MPSPQPVGGDAYLPYEPFPMTTGLLPSLNCREFGSLTGIIASSEPITESKTPPNAWPESEPHLNNQCKQSLLYCWTISEHVIPRGSHWSLSQDKVWLVLSDYLSRGLGGSATPADSVSTALYSSAPERYPLLGWPADQWTSVVEISC